ncbi:far upstream element-binding protein 1-like isoform X2 [Babylonia areolata]|uniref:far upstream element-binding protein 1-like isoform X2 n=1 Tax=Babylonia areolata TaxID=304850 RepID=UPI003FD20C56
MSGFGSRSGSYGRSRDDDYGGGSPVKMFVPAGECGKIIGRGGSKIRELQEQTGCKIAVSRDDEGNGTRRVELTGSDDAVDLAMDIINQIMESGDDRGGRRQTYGGGSYGAGAGAGGGGSKDIIQVDTSFVGRIIGKGGSRIRELQDETGCRINVSRDGGNYGQTEVELVGSRSSIQHAKQRIDDITQQAY